MEIGVVDCEPGSCDLDCGNQLCGAWSCHTKPLTVFRHCDQMVAPFIRGAAVFRSTPQWIKRVMAASSPILIASDHAGLDLKAELVAYLSERGFTVEDLGPDTRESVDYPDFGSKLALAIAAGSRQMGVLVCGTGIGISIAANRYSHIRAAVCHDVTTARLTRLHNDANVLCLGARVLGVETAKECVAAFLETAFEGGRHQRRVDKLSLPPGSRP